jgi:HSP20 family protein
MSNKKRPPLWFEEPVDEMKRTQEDFFENIEKMFKPAAMGRIIKFPTFRTNFIPVKMGETEKELLLRASIPGFRKEDIRLKVTPRLVYISAEKKSACVDKGDGFFKQESSCSSANRILQLPKEVKTEGITARYKGGVLEVVMQKKNPGKDKEVEVE